MIRRSTFLMALFSLAFSAGCSKPESEGGASANKPEATAAKGAEAKGPEKKKEKLTIGFSMDTLKEERWQRDRDLFKAKAETLGAQVLVQSANGDDALQNSQAENLLTQGIDVLVVVPHNAKTTATIVESAHKQGVPVIAYDRLILDSDVDLYVSFDNVKVGELQAEALVKKFPKGNYILIGGSPTDNNAKLFREGQMNILEAAHRQGRRQDGGGPVGQGLAAGRGAQDHRERPHQEQQQRHGGRGVERRLAGAAVQALGEQKLAGKVGVSGQDAELAACQRIAAGTQSMTGLQAAQAARREGGRARRQAGEEGARRREDADGQQRQEGRPERAHHAGRRGQGKPRLDGDRGRLPQGRGRLQGPPQGPVAGQVAP